MKNSLGHELGALLRLAGPLISAQLAHALMIFTDTLMMAMLGPQQLAGGALGATCYFIFSIFCTGVIAAVGSLIAIRHGAGDQAGITRLIQNGLWLAMLLGVASALCLNSLGPLLPHLGQRQARPARPWSSCAHCRWPCLATCASWRCAASPVPLVTLAR